jgi:hypothetical protein
MRKIEDSGEDLAERLIEFPSGGQVAPERLLQRDPRAGRDARLREAADDLRERARRDREVGKWPLGSAELAAQPSECADVCVVAVHVPQKGAQLVEGAPRSRPP